MVAPTVLVLATHTSIIKETPPRHRLTYRLMIPLNNRIKRKLPVQENRATAVPEPAAASPQNGRPVVKIFFLREVVFSTSARPP